MAEKSTSFTRLDAEISSSFQREMMMMKKSFANVHHWAFMSRTVSQRLQGCLWGPETVNRSTATSDSPSPPLFSLSLSRSLSLLPGAFFTTLGDPPYACNEQTCTAMVEPATAFPSVCHASRPWLAGLFPYSQD